jgi:polar amino acid transport system substrate-binding protein
LLLESNPGIFISPCESIAEVIDLLQSGGAQGALLPLLTAQAYTEGSLRNTFMIVSPPLNDEGIRLITLKDENPKLIKDFNKGLEKLRKTGFYDQNLSKWNLIQPPLPS